MLFAPDLPAGSQGSEGCTVLSFLPGRMLSFTWNAPPKFPAVRNGGARTFVVVELQPLGPGKTQVALTHLGWREGPEWDQVYAYFDRAWEVVLARLAHRFEGGPLDWADPWTPSPARPLSPAPELMPPPQERDIRHKCPGETRGGVLYLSTSYRTWITLNLGIASSAG
jgi:hypothetical protein